LIEDAVGIVQRPVTIEPTDVRAVGPEHEPKYRIRRVGLDEQGNLVLFLAHATWTEGAAFHHALLRRGVASPADRDRLLTGLVDGTIELPGIASVHCIVVTSDGHVVCTRRPDSGLYSPGRWSVSFEEQFTSSDFVDGADPVRAAALRGLAEELGLPPGRASVSVHATAIEVSLLNHCVLATVAAAATRDDVRAAWARTRSAETDALEFLDASADTLRIEAQRSDLQPTSPLRMLALAQHLARD
jgi:hypothetical protein